MPVVLMASVFLEVGQCGIQLGEAFWEEVSGRLPVDECHGFCRIGGRRRCIVVDTEPKVVRAIAKKESQLSKVNVFSGRSGRGANWAFAYSAAGKGQVSGLNESKSLAEDVLEAARKESERCDAFSGFVMTHSLCGGTGSGKIWAIVCLSEKTETFGTTSGTEHTQGKVKCEKI